MEVTPPLHARCCPRNAFTLKMSLVLTLEICNPSIVTPVHASTPSQRLILRSAHLARLRISLSLKFWLRAPPHIRMQFLPFTTSFYPYPTVDRFYCPLLSFQLAFCNFRGCGVWRLIYLGTLAMLRRCRPWGKAGDGGGGCGCGGRGRCRGGVQDD